jgi:hypothetical protein
MGCNEVELARLYDVDAQSSRLTEPRRYPTECPRFSFLYLDYPGSNITFDLRRLGACLSAALLLLQASTFVRRSYHGWPRGDLFCLHGSSHSVFRSHCRLGYN